MQIRYNIGTLAALTDGLEIRPTEHERKDSNPVRQFWRLTTLPGVRS